MAFVRTKRVGDKEYRQLVENYRENGEHRQRVLAHLGKHETLEEAIEAARAKVEASDLGKLREAKRHTEEYKEIIRRRYGHLLERYHGGETPNSTEVAERARLHQAPRTDEPIYYTDWGYPIYGYKKVEVPEEVEEYRHAFGNVEEAERVTWYGSSMYCYGLSRFRRYLEEYESRSKRAEHLERTYDKRQVRLEKLEAVLERGD
jgi:hypothetical protein